MKHYTLFLLGLTAVASSIANELPNRIYHDRVKQLCDTTLIIENTDCKTLYKAIEIRGMADATDTQGDAEEYFGVIWGAVSPNDYYAAILQCGNDAFNHFIDGPYVSLRAIHHTPDSMVEIGRWRINSDIAHGKKENSIAVELNASDNSAKLLAGNKSLHLIHELKFSQDVTSGNLGVLSKGRTDISLLVTESTPDLLSTLATPWSQHSLADYFESGTHPEIEGFWQYLDRDNDDRYCRLGGNYTVAIVRNGDGFDIIYTDGAKINSPQWNAGMKKGHLSPTIFDNHYNLIWYDSTFQPIAEECNASMEQNSILTLNFPLLKSSIRFSKMPTDK